MTGLLVADAVTDTRWADRRRRAEELRARHDFVAEPLALYARLLDAREEAYAAARAERPGPERLAAWVVERSLPGVMAAAMEAGTELLREAVLLRFHEGELEGIVGRWLDGADLTATDAFLARAAAGPALEALPETAQALRRADAGPRACPRCGGLPQLAYVAPTDDPLLTGSRALVCARCAHEWIAPRMTCASCGETDTARLTILDAVEVIPQVRVDACESCTRYLLTIDPRKDAAAVPEVDEIAALPLVLAAEERGFTKITPDLLGF